MKKKVTTNNKQAINDDERNLPTLERPMKATSPRSDGGSPDMSTAPFTNITRRTKAFDNASYTLSSLSDGNVLMTDSTEYARLHGSMGVVVVSSVEMIPAVAADAVGFVVVVVVVVVVPDRASSCFCCLSFKVEDDGWSPSMSSLPLRLLLRVVVMVPLLLLLLLPLLLVVCPRRRSPSH